MPLYSESIANINHCQ